jgi:RNA polymerase sigma-70 factor (ECF subfamily)
MRPMNGFTTDEVLYARLIRGELTALDTLYCRYQRHLFGFILTQLADRQEAEDVLHDAFMAVLRERLGHYVPTCFRAWIYQIARNLCLNRLRSRKRAARAVCAAAQVAVPSPVEPEGALVSAQSREALRRAVARLPPALAELFHLRTGGLSYEEMAQVLEIPVGTVKSRMHELMSRVREDVSL